jgi:O-antigen/teichoic acid export membrane protein
MIEEPNKENEQVEKLFEAARKEHQKNYRQLEKTSGILLVLASLLMATIFLVALAYSENSLIVQAISIVSLVVAVGLFARGLQQALVGRR